MARPNFARYFDIIDDNEQHQKRRRILSLRELLIATVSLLVGAALMLATLNWDDGPCLPSGSSAAGLVETVFAYNSTFVTSLYRESVWNSLVPVGRGTVEEPRGSHKFYTLSAVHQLHCLWSIQQELHSPERNDEQHPRHRHSRHCVDYLRQSLMCAADHTLEPVDPELGGVTGWGVKRTCRDWAKMKSWAEDRRASNAQGFGDAL